MIRLKDFATGLISLVVIVALLAGIPALLIVVIGFPLPTEAPSIDLIRTHLADGDIPDPFLVKTLALTVWLVWAQLAVAIVVEGVALARGRLSGRAPVLPGVQAVVGKLVASTVLLISAFAPTRSAAPAPIVAPAAVAEPAPGFDPGVGVGVGVGVGATIGPSVGSSPEAGRAAIVPAGPVGGTVDGAGAVYTTRPGDTWWDVAERLLGDGLRWSEVRTLNLGRAMAGGGLITERTESVRAGWQLRVPVDAAADLLDPEPPAGDGPTPFGSARPATLVYGGPTGSDSVGAGPPYQVVAGDNLWDIAERHLGDPFRWPEIFEASSGLTQTFGRQITDPNLIWPDSILVLPGDALDVPEADVDLVAEVLGAGGRVPGRPGSIGQVDGADGLDAAADPGVVVDGPDGALGPDGAVGSDGPAGVVTGGRGATVDGAGGEGDGEADRGRHDGAAATAPPSVPADPGPSGPVGPGGGPGQGVPGEGPVGPAALAMGSGALLVATGLVGLLRRARRLRLAETGEASVPQPPPLNLVDVETVLRNRSDRVAAETLLAAIATLGRGVGRVDEPTTTPEVIRLVGGRLEVIVDGGGPADLPAPWLEVPIVGGATLPAGRRALAADVDRLVEPVDRARPGPDDGDGTERPTGSTGGVVEPLPAPTLVTVGGGLLLNLEAIGVVAIDGPPELVGGLTRSLIHELSTAVVGGPGDPQTPAVEVLVSDRLPGVDLHPTLRWGSLDRLLADVGSWLDRVELALAASGASGPWALRAAGRSTALPTPIVVVADGGDDTDGPGLAALAERARERRLPLAVVLVGDPANRSIRPSLTATIADGRVHLDPLGLAAVFQVLDEELLLGVEALIDHARRAPIVARPEVVWAPGDGGRHRGEGSGRATAGDPSQVPTEETPEHEIATELPDDDGEEITDRAGDDDRGLLIRVLGPVEVEGGPSALSEEERSILAFLALAGPSSTTQIRDAVWPGPEATDQQVEDVIEDLARRLGPLLSRAGDGRHRVRSTVTDLGSARRWIDQARAMTGERSRNLFQLALSEVRGRPFTGVSERRWQWVEDHRLAVVTQATSLLIDACFDLCDSAYEADDLHLALWACEVASLVDPLQETVVVRRVQLLSILERSDEAEVVVERWERDFSRSAGRPPPRGPRAALATTGEAARVG
jgi:nucleoid-associated protein YgaU